MKRIELVEKRKAKEKHFLQDDGSIVAVMYNDNVHFKKNGKYEEIDNTLIEENDYYYNSNNDYKVYFNKNNKNSIMKLEKENHYIDIQLKNSKEVEIKKIEKNENSIETIYYEDIYNMIDLEYQILPTKIKETIILKNRETIKDKITFIVKSNLELTLNKNNSITAKNNDEIVFQLDIPFMIDSSQKFNHNICYELSAKDDYYELDLILDSEWLKSNETIYPVYIDPTITNSYQTNSVYDTYIYPGDTGVDKNSLPYLKIGVEKVNDNYITNRALLRFDLPEIGTASEVIGANLILQTYYGDSEDTRNSKRTLEVHKVTTPWTEQDANWEQMSENYDPKVETLQFLSRRVRVEEYEVDENGHVIDVSYDLNPYSQVYSDITNLVKHWYKDTQNNGIMIKANPEVYIDDNYPLVYSKNNTINDGLKPLLEITYRNQNGLESYMNYKTQTFTDGNMYLNTYNGNLVGVFNIGSTFNTKMPVNLDLIYNTNDILTKQNGFKFNLNQKIREVILDENNCLEYEDEDGTIHYFYKDSEDSSKYRDEDGLGFTLQKNDIHYYMTDKDNNKKTFKKTTSTDDYYYLIKIEDTKLNSIDITLNSENKITKILDGNNFEISITYDTTQTTIVSPDRTTILSYTNNNITSISTLNGVTNVTYNANNLISSITDISGLKINYEYYEQKPYRVKKVIQYGNNNTLGNYFTVEYDFDSTRIIDNKGRVNTLIFDSLGKLHSSNIMPSLEDISNTYSTTEEYGGDSNNKNKLLTSTIPVKYVKNYLKNTSFEADDIIFASSANLTTSFSNEYAVTGYRSLKLESTTKNQFITLTPYLPTGNHYTFSGYFKSTTDLIMKIGYIDGNGQTVRKNLLIESSDEFIRQDISIYFDTGESVNMLIIEIAQNNAGITYIDDIQLEEGEVANNYNIVENSDFSDGLSDWTLEATIDDYNNIDEWGMPQTVTADTSEVFKVVKFNNDKNTALEITMNPIGRSRLKKVFPIKGKQGDIYNISFWMKNDGLVGNEIYVGNSVKIYFKPIGHDADYCIMSSDDFKPNEKWQFVSYRYIAEEDYESITLDFNQGRQANKMLITNLTFYKDLNTSYYNYDDNGNLNSIMDSEENANIFKYDKNNQLINSTTPKGKNFTYEYDNIITDRVLSATSSMGITNQVKYDSFGNPILTKITKKSDEEIQNGTYKIRGKGTDKYIKAEMSFVFAESNACSNTIWNLEKVDNKFKFIYSVMPTYSLTHSNGILIMSNGNINNLFTLEKNDNGSYYIKLDSDNKYIKFTNSSIEVSPLIENDPTFEFYFEQIEEKFMECSATYSEDGRFITSVTDNLLNKNLYTTDSITGLITSVQNAKNQVTHYNYNNERKITTITQGNKIVNYTYDNNKQLSKITQGNKEYNFIYDEFLNLKKVMIGDDITLITNEYEAENGNLLKTTYGNGQIVCYSYDDLNRIKTVEKSSDTYNYKYDSNGNLAKIISNNNSISYIYDSLKRMHQYINNYFRINYDYDSNNNIIYKKYKLNNFNHTLDNTFDKDDNLIKTVSDNQTFNYQYDGLGRLMAKNINNNYHTLYDYVTLGKRTSNLIESMQNGDNKYSYKYDNLDNITDIYYNDNLINQYYYDDYNELITTKDYTNNQQINYNYDENGNILTKTYIDLETNNIIKTDTYQYVNLNWKDQLTNYNGINITYDSIGNPVMIDNNINLIWTEGKNLTSYVDNIKSLTINYKYNKENIRTSKIVNGVETKFYLENDNIIYEQRENNLIYYLYDLTGLIGLKYNDSLFYYVKNSVGDIIGILDSNYDQIVSYKYDDWGKVISIKDNFDNEITDINNIGIINPFRYRGYYYDNETKLYYLNNRYYNPEWSRFINADGILGQNEDQLSYNLYIYTSNNPINYSDLNGKWFFFDKKRIIRTITYLLDPLGSTRKIGRNSDIIKQEQQSFEATKQNVAKTVSEAVNNFVGEIGVGTGADIKITDNISVGAYQDVTFSYKKGKVESNIAQSSGATAWGVGPSTTKIREYPIDEKSCGYGFSPYDPYVMKCPQAYDAGISVGNEIVDASDSLFIGLNVGFHFGVGFHIKVGWEIDR